jgi:hypothetical protein
MRLTASAPLPRGARREGQQIRTQSGKASSRLLAPPGSIATPCLSAVWANAAALPVGNVIHSDQPPSAGVTVQSGSSRVNALRRCLHVCGRLRTPCDAELFVVVQERYGSELVQRSDPEVQCALDPPEAEDDWSRRAQPPHDAQPCCSRSDYVRR